jgi:hypothetical protein
MMVVLFIPLSCVLVHFAHATMSSYRSRAWPWPWKRTRPRRREGSRLSQNERFEWANERSSMKIRFGENIWKMLCCLLQNFSELYVCAVVVVFNIFV